MSRLPPHNLDKARLLVHTPAEMSTAFLQWAADAHAGKGIPFGIPAVDKFVIPLRPGNLMAFIARPGHCKTAMLAYLARTVGKRLEEAGDKSQVVVYVTWEQSVEELTSLFLADGEHSVTDIAWGRADMDALARLTVRGVTLPVWVIGQGFKHAGDLEIPRMTPDVVLAAIETMQQDFGVRPALMLFDYLQLIPVGSYKDRMEQVTEAPIRVKELALRLGCPAVVGVQARREVDDRDDKIPELRDAQWASSIEQTCDKVFALWRPVLTEAEGAFVELNDKRVKVTDTMLVMRMLKQRGDQGRHTWVMHFAPQYLRLAEMELENGISF